MKQEDIGVRHKGYYWQRDLSEKIAVWHAGERCVQNVADKQWYQYMSIMKEQGGTVPARMNASKCDYALEKPGV